VVAARVLVMCFKTNSLYIERVKKWADFDLVEWYVIYSWS